MLELLHPGVLLPWLVAMAFGVFVGATPGLTATMAVALLVPVTFYMPADVGLAMILGLSFTAIFAGSIPAVCLRIPGTPASAAMTLDAHEMARQGKSGLALRLSLICSCVGGTIGVLAMMVMAPQLARFALRFSDYEYFWLCLFGLGMSAVISVGRTGKGMLAVVLGVLLATVGLDTISGVPRFTFGYTGLMSGQDTRFIPVMIGLFGVSEVIRNILDPQALGKSDMTGDTRTSWREVLTVGWRQKFTVLKSSILGTFVGALPGAGGDIGAWAAYGVAQRTSKTPEKFGQGIEEGVVAPTSAANAGIAGAWIPALVFGIPGDSLTAIVLGALLQYDIKTGPLIFEQHASEVNHIFMIALITQGLLVIAGLVGIRAFGIILKLPRKVVLIAVVVFCVVGSFALGNSLFDVWIMAIFGVVGFFLERQRVPLAPLILGLILGPMVERSLRVGLIKSGGDWTPFFTRPICVVFLAVLVLALLAPPLIRRMFTKPANPNA